MVLVKAIKVTVNGVIENLEGLVKGDNLDITRNEGRERQIVYSTNSNQYFQRIETIWLGSASDGKIASHQFYIATQEMLRDGVLEFECDYGLISPKGRDQTEKPFYEQHLVRQTMEAVA